MSLSFIISETATQQDPTDRQNVNCRYWIPISSLHPSVLQPLLDKHP